MIAAITREVLPGGLSRPALAAVTGLLLASSSLPQANDDPPPAGSPAATNSPRSDPGPLPIGGDGGNVLYLIAIVGLLGLLAFTVWKEFRVALHPHWH
jgi:hypothetical protein